MIVVLHPTHPPCTFTFIRNVNKFLLSQLHLHEVYILNHTHTTPVCFIEDLALFYQNTFDNLKGIF
jgi:hypothetical protein